MDQQTRCSLKSASTLLLVGCIVWILLVIPSWICWAIGSVKVITVKDENVKTELETLAILTIVLGFFTVIGGIICAAVLRSKCLSYLK